MNEQELKERNAKIERESIYKQAKREAICDFVKRAEEKKYQSYGRSDTPNGFAVSLSDIHAIQKEMEESL